MADELNRHTPFPVLLDYVERNRRGSFDIPGSPMMILAVDPADRRLAIIGPATGPEVDVSRFRRVHFSSRLDGGLVQQVLSVDFTDDLEEVYGVLCSIADRVQLGGEEFGPATETALDALSSILERRSLPSEEQQVGLMGELLFLQALANERGLDAAVRSWRGPRGEEHDFGTTDTDLEVKTTLSEEREHWISNLRQLVRTGDRPLYLVSVQLTRAGGESGWSLPQLIDNLRSLGRSTDLEKLLRETVYSDDLRDLLTDRWTLRTEPAFYEVTDDFPAITPARLKAAVPAAHLVVDLRYRLRLTDLPESEPFAHFGSVVPPESSDR